MNKFEILKDNSCFRVPDNYFDTLTKEVMHKVAKEKRWNKIKKYTAIAASIAALTIVVSIIFYLKQDINPTQLAMKQTTDSIKTADNQPIIEMAELKIPTQQAHSNSTSVQVKHQPETSTTTSENISNESFNNTDYQILDYYAEEIEQIEYLY